MAPPAQLLADRFAHHADNAAHAALAFRGGGGRNCGGGGQVTHTLILPIQLLSKNSRDKLTWRQRHALRLSYTNIVGLKYPRKHETPDYRQRVTVTRLMVSRERAFDPQNLGAGSSIELLDSFKLLGWFRDDTETWLEPHFEQKKSATERGPKVRVEIEPL